ncbi:MAG TPA: hypothetical protein VGB79_11490 [Allosphingosinicella sp.]|jgi:Arc/MetJ family transcription regulator
MSKYEPLAQALRRHRDHMWIAGFDEVERILGFPLPASARNYREWWANQRSGGHSQTKGWQDAGWQVWKVDLAGEQVTFRRVAGEGPSRQPLHEDETTELLIDRAGEMLGIADRDSIVREALRSLIRREAGRRLAALGGTMPDLEAPPRRRFPE